MGHRPASSDRDNMFKPEFHDPVFEPSPDFNFEDESHQVMSNQFGQQNEFGLYDGTTQSDFPDGLSSNQQGHAFSQNYWPDPFQEDFAGHGILPPSAQGDIVNDRTDSVTQFFGQITPPENDANGKSVDAPQQAADAAKRKERARNAANKRHAKSKKAGTESDIQGVDEEGSEIRGERQAHYREKNRVAAAKCRAKKKNHNDNLEEMHRGEASKNKILKAELMGLRNELAQLKSLTLEHSPDNCRCHGIHEYSMRQASLIARGAAPQYGPSPAQESPMSADTPASDAAMVALFAGQDQMSPVTGNESRRSSFALNNWSRCPS